MVWSSSPYLCIPSVCVCIIRSVSRSSVNPISTFSEWFGPRRFSSDLVIAQSAQYLGVLLPILSDGDGHDGHGARS